MKREKDEVKKAKNDKFTKGTTQTNTEGKTMATV